MIMKVRRLTGLRGSRQTARPDTTTLTSPRRPRRRTAAVGTALLVLASLVLTPKPAFAGTDDYPSPWRAPTAQDSMYDSWHELNRECTSFVAWRLHSRNGFEMPFNDNANGWGSDATARGYAVNMTPAVGAVAWWSSGSGHVAWVEAVNGSNVTIEEYNYDLHGDYNERTIAAGSVSGYIHFKDLASAQGGPVVDTAATGPNVFYVGVDQAIWQWVKSGGTWVDNRIGGQLLQGTTMSTIDDPATGVNIFYTGLDGALWQWMNVGGNWTDTKIGGQLYQRTSPIAIDDPTSGVNVFYTGVDGAIWQWVRSGGTWVDNKIGGQLLQGTTMSAIDDPASGVNIFYTGLDGALWQWSRSAGNWSDVKIGGQLYQGTSPMAVDDAATGPNVFYVGVDQAIWQWVRSGGTWVDNKIGGQVYFPPTH